MRILLISDTHGELEKTRTILNTCGHVDVSIHLGDIGFSLQELYKFHMVCGNHDKHCSLPKEIVMELDRRKVLCLHGNMFDDESIQETFERMDIKSEDLMDVCMNILYRKLATYAKQRGCDTVFFGHTHHPFCGVVEDVVLVNPGSVCFGTPQSGYAIVQIEDKKIRTDFYYFDKNTIVHA